MHINLKNSADNFPLLSPLFEHNNRDSPYLSPLPNSALLKYDDPQDDFLHFQLEPQHEQQELPPLAEELEEQSLIMLQQPLDYLLERQHNSQNQEEESQLHDHHKSEAILQKQCEMYSTRFMDDKEELQQTVMKFSPVQSSEEVQTLIEFLIERSGQEQTQLLAEGQSLCGQNLILRQTFQILLGKFKKLRKTKEQMTKYCMRKAFKFIADKMKRDRTHNRDVDTCMKLYFSKNQNGSNFTIPFKKNSVEKTMNGNFLKRVFSSHTFVEDYHQFLEQFRNLMMEDNDKKIKYLAQMLKKYLATNDIKKIESIKRLPWTRETLTQTQQLGVSLLSYAQGGSKRDKIKEE